VTSSSNSVRLNPCRNAPWAWWRMPSGSTIVRNSRVVSRLWRVSSSASGRRAGPQLVP
jgi:hypothetical protein